AGFRQRREDARETLGVGIAAAQIGDETGTSLRLQRSKAARYARLAHSVTPSATATAKMSLSPRPQRLTTSRWSLGRPGATFATCASAWAGSSAGMIPSGGQQKWDGPSASRSVIATYSTRPMS